MSKFKGRAAVKRGMSIKPDPKAPGPKKCAACSGSGVYDNTGSPKCGSCNGTGLASGGKS